MSIFEYLIVTHLNNSPISDTPEIKLGWVERVENSSDLCKMKMNRNLVEIFT